MKIFNINSRYIDDLIFQIYFGGIEVEFPEFDVTDTKINRVNIFILTKLCNLYILIIFNI